MKQTLVLVLLVLPLSIYLGGCANSGKAEKTVRSNTGKGDLPAPYETKSTKNFSKVIGWKDGHTPVAPTALPLQNLQMDWNIPAGCMLPAMEIFS